MNAYSRHRASLLPAILLAATMPLVSACGPQSVAIDLATAAAEFRGSSESQQELDKVLKIAQEISDVRQVANHIRVDASGKKAS